MKKIHRVIGCILMVFLLSSCGTNTRETIASDFLTQYYQVTEEEVLAFSELKSAKDEAAYDQYIEKVKEKYASTMLDVEMDRLAKNRMLSYMDQYAYENKALYNVSAVKLERETENQDFEVFKYTLEVMETDTEETLTLSGQIKVETNDNGDFVTYTELDIPKTQ